MKALKAKIRWSKEWSNPPTLEILVDTLEENLFYYHKKVNSNTLWFAEKNGLVRFYAENPRDREGYAGHTFRIMTINGEYDLKGPWSSRSGVMNKYFKQCMEVSLTDDPDAYERGYTFYGGAVTLEFAEDAIKLVEESRVELIKVKNRDEFVYVPRKVNDCIPEIGRNNRCVHCGYKHYGKGEGDYFIEMGRRKK